jgi:hypothetical protein
MRRQFEQEDERVTSAIQGIEDLIKIIDAKQGIPRIEKEDANTTLIEKYGAFGA